MAIFLCICYITGAHKIKPLESKVQASDAAGTVAATTTTTSQANQSSERRLTPDGEQCTHQEFEERFGGLSEWHAAEASAAVIKLESAVDKVLENEAREASASKLEPTEPPALNEKHNTIFFFRFLRELEPSIVLFAAIMNIVAVADQQACELAPRCDPQDQTVYFKSGKEVIAFWIAGFNVAVYSLFLCFAIKRFTETLQDLPLPAGMPLDVALAVHLNTAYKTQWTVWYSRLMFALIFSFSIVALAYSAFPEQFLMAQYVNIGLIWYKAYSQYSGSTGVSYEQLRAHNNEAKLPQSIPQSVKALAQSSLIKPAKALAFGVSAKLAQSALSQRSSLDHIASTNVAEVRIQTSEEARQGHTSSPDESTFCFTIWVCFWRLLREMEPSVVLYTSIMNLVAIADQQACQKDPWCREPTYFDHGSEIISFYIAFFNVCAFFLFLIQHIFIFRLQIRVKPHLLRGVPFDVALSVHLNSKYNEKGVKTWSMLVFGVIVGAMVVAIAGSEYPKQFLMASYVTIGLAVYKAYSQYSGSDVGMDYTTFMENASLDKMPSSLPLYRHLHKSSLTKRASALTDELSAHLATTTLKV